jgi:hypothetical protein
MPPPHALGPALDATSDQSPSDAEVSHLISSFDKLLEISLRLRFVQILIGKLDSKVILSATGGPAMPEYKLLCRPKSLRCNVM